MVTQGQDTCWGSTRSLLLFKCQKKSLKPRQTEREQWNNQQPPNQPHPKLNKPNQNPQIVTNNNKTKNNNNKTLSAGFPA